MGNKWKSQIKYTSDLNVHDAALDRIRWIFDEYDNDVCVSTSGGKDSTVVMELAAIVNKERGLPPLRVFFLDQECELGGTVEYMRYLMYERDDLDMRWYQVPFWIENATNTKDNYLHAWGEGEEWVRDKEPNSIHSIDSDARDFYALIMDIGNEVATAILTGMRAEESPIRYMTLTSNPTYKWVTWCSRGKRPGRNQKFHPLYDWSYRDIWKAIDQYGWRYNSIYDLQFQHGVPVSKMRVSNYHHETSVSSLDWLQEAEPETWEAATRRLEGISTRGHLGDTTPKKLPYMFADWEEYMHHLIDTLIDGDPKGQETFRGYFEMILRVRDVSREDAARGVIRAVLLNDQWGTTIRNFIDGKAKKIKDVEKAVLGL